MKAEEARVISEEFAALKSKAQLSDILTRIENNARLGYHSVYIGTEILKSTRQELLNLNYKIIESYDKGLFVGHIISW